MANLHLPQCFTLSQPQLPAYVAIGTLAGVCLAGLWVLRRRKFHGQSFFLIGYLATQGWLLFVLMELLSSTASCKMWWAEVSFIFISTLATAWCYFLYDFAHARSVTISLPRLASLLIAPTVIVLMSTTNKYHGLFYLPETGFIETPQGPALKYVHGPLFYVAVSYLYAFMAGGILIAARSFLRARPAYRGFFLTLLLITIIPSAGNIAYVGFGIAFFGFDPTPFLFSFAIVLIVRMILSNRMFDAASVAKGALFYDAEQPVAVIDETGEFTITNPSFRILLEESGNADAKCLADWEELRALAFDATLPGGTLLEVAGRAFELRVMPIDKPLEGATSCMGWTLVLKDVTDIRSSNAELSRAVHKAESANRMKSQFIANMSHEIRTPLNGILGMAEVLSHEVTSPRHAEMVETIRQSGDVLLNVLNDILDLSKIEAGKLALMPEDFDLNEIIRRASGLHRLSAEAKRIDLIIDVKDNGPLRVGDPMRLMQVLNNLLSNAIKFTETGSVTLEMSNPDSGDVVFSVVDTGIGMNEEQIQRIFEDFEQADGAITRRYGGTGLGMSIVRRLVSMMNGKISVTSRKGAGTRVELRLPLPVVVQEAPVDVAAPANEPDRPASALAGLRVLAADDNGTNRLVLGSLLKRAGIKAVLVANGREAVERFSEMEWDAVLLDISMPEMDGMAALGAIDAIARKTGKTRPPCIVISANVMADQIREYRAAGFDACIGKPFRGTDVLQTLSKELGIPA